MTRRRGKAVVSALLCAALTAAGCGLGPGADVGDVGLSVTREFGAEPMLETSVAANESDTVMRLLEGQAEVETRYGGGFVHAIDGVAEGSRHGDPYDWFFYVDGVEAEIGAAEFEVEGGERVWWDHHDWAVTNHVPAVVGSWPAPFSDGIGGKPHPVVVECLESRGSFRTDDVQNEPRNCATAREALGHEGVAIADGSPEHAIRMLVGPWAKLRQDPAARLIEAGPAESGVFADFQPGVRPFRGIDGERTNADGAYELLALDQGGRVARDLGPNAGLVAATSRYGGLPVWVVTGGTPSAVRAAAEALEPKLLRNHFAIAMKDRIVSPLPLQAP